MISCDCRLVVNVFQADFIIIFVTKKHPNKGVAIN